MRDGLTEIKVMIAYISDVEAEVKSCKALEKDIGIMHLTKPSTNPY